MSKRKKKAKETTVQSTLGGVEKKVSPSKSEIPLKKLSGVGKKLEEKLIAAGYSSVDKISRARATAMAKKVSGLSKAKAISLVKDAKAMVKESSVKKATTKTTADPDTTQSEPEIERPSLTEIPGVGGKLARSLEKGGYNSVARLSRSTPASVSKRVDGLGLDKAIKLVQAAKDLIKDRERKAIMGAEEVVTSAKTKKTPKKSTKPAKKDLPKKEPAKKAKPKKKPKKSKSTKKTTKKPPKEAKIAERKQKKAKRSKSGLPVPKAVLEVTKSLRKKWRDGEKRKLSPTQADLDEISKLPETVEVVALTSESTNDLLVETAMDILNEAMLTGRPHFEIPSRSADNIVWDELRDLLLLGMKTISRPYHSLASVMDATRTARVMEIVFHLLQSNLHATKREVFYSDVNLFREQKYSDKIIEDVASMLRTTRDSVHIVASARGSAMGRVKIRDGGDLIDLTKMGTGGWSVTPFLDQLEIIESDAEYILLSEKDAAMMRLSEVKYWNRQPCIVLTGKGSGDIATRAFLKMLVKELEIPAFALVDSDPYGHYIYSVFLRGSKRLSYESPFIATPDLKLLGVLSRDLDAFNVPKSVRIPMEPTDIKRVKEMLKEPFVRKNKEWVTDLELMLKLKEKAEIQAFAAHSFEFLTDEYLPTKLETGDWI
ncbi:MAG: helix-hairpin-helix domain-containing protein [Candidatus Thorarchaeota archaeon]